MRNGVTTEDRDHIKTLGRENRELRQANKNSPQGVSLFCAHSRACLHALPGSGTELDRPLKR